MSDTGDSPVPRFDAPSVRPLALLAASAAVNASLFSGFEMASYFAPRPAAAAPAVVFAALVAPPRLASAAAMTADDGTGVPALEVPPPPSLTPPLPPLIDATRPPPRPVLTQPAAPGADSPAQGIVAASLCRAGDVDATGCVRVDAPTEPASFVNAGFPATFPATFAEPGGFH